MSEETNTVIQHKNVLTEVQDYICEELNKDPILKEWGIELVPEHMLDIDYQIKNSLSRQGIACVVTTLKAEYQGHDGIQNVWNVSNLEIDVVENTGIRRPWLKKKELTDGTCSDVVYRIQELLGGPQAIVGFGRFNPLKIDIDESDGMLIGKAHFQCCVKSDVEGIINIPENIPIQFALKTELPSKMSQLTNDSEYVKPTSQSTEYKYYYELGPSSLGGIVIYADETNGGKNSSITINEKEVATKEWVLQQLQK